MQRVIGLLALAEVGEGDIIVLLISCRHRQITDVPIRKYYDNRKK